MDKFQISTFKPIICQDENMTAIYKGRNEKGNAIFELSNGIDIEATYEEWMKEGEVYEYKVTV